jgi:dTDP-4-amino-4,6-dideoxygalactose transaminase
MKSKLLFANPSKQNHENSHQILKAIERVMTSAEYILGSEVLEFEKAFAEYIGVQNCVGVNSGTDALILSLRALGIGPGDEVIAPSHTAVATIAAICATGATPVFVDVDLNTFTLMPEKAERAITRSTKAIIAVHIYGHPCDMNSLLSLVKRTGIHLLEDCAQAHGAEWNGKKVGSFGVISCFSFYPTKNLGAIGDGGAILTNDDELAERLRRIRQYGWDRDRTASEISGVSRLDEIQAAILNVKLKKLKKSNDRRIEIAKLYENGIRNPEIILPSTSQEAVHAFHLFVIRTNIREKIINQLNLLEIYPGIHYRKPVHAQPAYLMYQPLKQESLANTNQLADTVLSLPMYPELDDSDVQRVIEGLQNVQS